MNKIGYLPIVFSVFFSPLLQAKQNVCVFDLLGKAGESYKLMEEWALAAKAWGADINLTVYQSEEAVDKNFKTNKCDAAAMTTMRSREYNKFGGSIDALGGIPNNEIDVLLKEMAEGRNPQDIKKILALELVERFHGAEAAEHAHKGAGNLITEGELPEGTPEVTISRGEYNGEISIVSILRAAGLTKNSAQSKDAVSRGAVKVDWEVVDANFTVKENVTLVIQASKKAIAKVTFTD